MPFRSKSLSPEPWPWARPRVLVEHPDEAEGLAVAGMLRRAGYAVAVCPGPDEQERCPLTGPEGCAVADGADVVVSALGAERSERREVLAALRRRCPDVPLVAVASGRRDELAPLVEGSQVIDSPVAQEPLLAAVRLALGRQA